MLKMLLLSTFGIKKSCFPNDLKFLHFLVLFYASEHLMYSHAIQTFFFFFPNKSYSLKGKCEEEA